jgi:hypothetical protein
MTTRRTPALIVLSFAVLAGFSAPAAGALPSCQDAGTTSTCRTNGSVSIKARPGTVAPPASQAGIRWNTGPGISINLGR